MMRSIFMLMYCLFWIWVALGLFFKGDYLSSILNLLLGIFLYFVIFSGVWKKKKRKAASNSTHSSDSGSFWDMFISDSASDSTGTCSSSDSGGGGDGGGD